MTSLLIWSVPSIGQSLNFQLNDSSLNNYYGIDDYGILDTIPAGFGEGELTFQLWIKPDTSYPIGTTASNPGTAINWSDSDEMPYSSCCWWYRGNFLLDGHANGGGRGTFSLQFYGGGRLRWHWEGQNEYVVAQAWPANTTPSLLDGDWHLISCIRSFITETDSSLLELWVDDGLVATEKTSSQTNMHTYWDNWNGWAQPGWFLGCEKQVAPGDNDHYEDYKGLVDEMRFYNYAKTSTEIINDYNRINGCGSGNGLVGYFDFSENMGTTVCDSIDTNDCWTLYNIDSFPALWDPSNAPCAGSCAQNLLLTMDDSPLVGTYQAAHQITINGPLVLASGGMVTLNAPAINFSSDFTVPANSILTTHSDGCSN